MGRYGSPGRVLDGEILESFLIYPADFEKDQICLSVLSHAEKKGMSVMGDRASDREIIKLLNLRLKKATHSFHGVARFTCGSVRSLRADTSCDKRNVGDRFYTVLDADMDGLPNHAEVYVTNPKPPEKTNKMRWRKERRELLKLMTDSIVRAADYHRSLDI